MNASPVLGIDLGTTNSVVAIADGANPSVLADGEGFNLIPSVVSFHPSGTILVGRAARDRRLLDAAHTVYSVKRLIGRPFLSAEVRRAQERFPFELRQGQNGGVVVAGRDETYSLSEISAFVLREIRAVAEQALGSPCSKAVVTVPANFNELQRGATKAAGRVAGLDVVRILNEPTAAALAYGYGKGSRERIAVFDFGGGTFDVTLLELSGDVFEVLATAGDTYLGGDDIDVMIADQMAAAFLEHHRYDARQDPQAYERLRAAAEWAKCQLSDEEEVQLRVEELAYGAGGMSLDLTFALTRKALESMAQPLVARTLDVCEDAMKVANLAVTQLDNVILVGGSTRIPLVQRMVAEYFGRPPLSDIDPDLVVAKGAAIQGAALAAPAAHTLGRVQLKKITQAELGTRAAPPPSPAKQPFKPPPPTALGPARPGATRPGNRTMVGPVPPALQGGPAAPPAPPPPLDAEETTQVQALGNPGSPSADGIDFEFPSIPPGEGGGSIDLPVPELQPAPQPPLLLDVTPHSLGIETVGGFCERVIQRNATIPVEQTRVFSTARDNQEGIRVRVCQGESRRIEDNQQLGEVELSGLRPAARGKVQIGVTFVMSADGTLGVQARDLDTGNEQTVRIQLVGALSESEIEQMRERQARMMGIEERPSP